MKKTLLALSLVLLAVSCGLLAQAEHTPSDKSVGLASCFRMGVATALARLQLNNRYVCAVNALIGPLPGDDFAAFGPAHGFATIESEDRAFYETYYGTPTNGFVGVSRVNVTSYSAAGSFMHNETERVGYHLNATGGLTSDLISQGIYNVSSRPWYAGALASEDGSYVTRAPYIFSTVNLRAASSLQCRSADGSQLEIIAGAGLTLDTLTYSVLNSDACPLFDKSAGAAFVINEDGMLLMQNDVVLTDLIPAKNATGLVGQAAKQLSSINENVWTSQAAALFEYDGEEYEILAFPITGQAHSVDVSVWRWSVVTVTQTSSKSSAASSTIRSRFYLGA